MIWAALKKSAVTATLATAMLVSQAKAVFTIGVISDTQNYVDLLKPQPLGVDTFKQQMQYLVDTRADKNLVFATHVGDVVQHGDGQFRSGPADARVYWNSRQEWDYASESMMILTNAGIPFGMSPGNHDYDSYSWWAGENSPGPSRPLTGSTTWNQYFGPGSAHFAGKAWYGEASANALNSYQTFSGDGRQFLHLSLEMEPTDEALAWAQGVIDAHPGMPTIMTTHEWLDPKNDGTNNRSNDYNSYFAGAANNTPDQVWDKFVRKNDQIFLVLAGHDFTGAGIPGVSNGQNRRMDLNDAGNPVWQLVQDYQGNTVGPDGVAGSAVGGAGWMRFIEFDLEAGKMHFYTYSTLLGVHAGQNGENTFNTPADWSDFYLDIPSQVPEPATLSVLALGGLALLRRRA